MKPPKSFFNYTLNFLADGESGLSVEETIPFAFKYLNSQEKQDLRDYFIYLLSSGLSEEELLLRWRSGHPGMFFPGGTAIIMQWIIDALDEDADGKTWHYPNDFILAPG